MTAASQAVRATVTRVLNVRRMGRSWILRADVLDQGARRCVSLPYQNEDDARAVKPGDSVAFRDNSLSETSGADWRQSRPAIGVDKTPTHDPRELAAEHEFWQRVRSTLHPLPLFIRRRLMARVEHSHETKGRHIADLTLRDIVRRELPHIHRVLQRYSINPPRQAGQAYENPFRGLEPLYHNFDRFSDLIARFDSLPDFSPEDVELLAQDIAIYANATLAELAADIESLDNIETGRRFYSELFAIANVFQVSAAGARKRRMKIDELAAAISKMLDARFWNRNLLRYSTRWREHLRISLGDVRRSVSPYCSKERVNAWRERRQRSRDIMAGLEIEDTETGERFSLLEQIDKSTSNPEKRRTELLTRIGGFEKVANEQGFVGSFFTITTPSKYHAFNAFGHRNAKWQGSSPRAAQQYLNIIWQRIRAELAREEIGVFGLRVAEAHHDGTPHWHGLLFTLPEHQDALRGIMQRYATDEDADELTTQHGIQPRFDFKPIDPEQGSATGYIVKYVSKNIDGYALDNESDDESGRPLKETAQHASAWASTWGIRQFQFLTGVPVSVWRELRRMRNQAAADLVNPLFAEIHRAADVGDWPTFVNLMGGPLAKRCDLPVRAYYQDRPEPNAWGEYLTVIKGISMPLINIPPVITRLREFRIVKKSPESAERPGDGCSSFDLKGAPAPSGTRVNNCTEVKKRTESDRENTARSDGVSCTNSGAPPPGNPEQIQIGKLTREQRRQLRADCLAHKTARKKSAAEELEALAYDITTGDCSDADQVRAENYLRAAAAIRETEKPVTAAVADLAGRVLEWAKLREIPLGRAQALALAQGGQATVIDNVYRANLNTGELVLIDTFQPWRRALAKNKTAELMARWRAAVPR